MGYRNRNMNLLYLYALLAWVGDTPLDAYTTPGSFLFGFRRMRGQKSLAYELTKITANLALGELRNAKENGNYYNGSYRDETTRRIHSFIPSSPKVSRSLSLSFFFFFFWLHSPLTLCMSALFTGLLSSNLS